VWRCGCGGEKGCDSDEDECEERDKHVGCFVCWMRGNVKLGLVLRVLVEISNVSGIPLTSDVFVSLLVETLMNGPCFCVSLYIRIQRGPWLGVRQRDLVTMVVCVPSD
jgi:hypothetical protein